MININVEVICLVVLGATLFLSRVMHAYSYSVVRSCLSSEKAHDPVLRIRQM